MKNLEKCQHLAILVKKNSLPMHIGHQKTLGITIESHLKPILFSRELELVNSKVLEVYTIICILPVEQEKKFRITF